MATKRPRILVTLDPTDVEALGALKQRVPNMSRNAVIVAALRIGVAELRKNPAQAATVPPLAPEPEPKRKGKAGG